MSLSNPLFQALRGNQPDLAGDFQRFLHQMKGVDPHQEINRLLQSGQITPQQLNQAQQMAQQMQGFLGVFKK